MMPEASDGALRILENARLKERVHRVTLPCGLPVFCLPKPGYMKKYAVLATRYGSNDNEFVVPGEEGVTRVPEGIAHFLEHQLFEDQEGNVFDLFSRNGASCNAFTSYTTTAYHFSGTEKFEENLRLLLDFVTHPHFSDEGIQKEIGIIAQEIKMYQDSPEWRGFTNLLESLYVRHPVRIDITGSLESIRKIAVEDLRRCYRTFYHPSNMVLFAAGDITAEETFAIAGRYFEDRPASAGGEIRRVYPDEPRAVARAEVSESLPISIPKVIVGFKDPDVGYGGLDLVRKDVEVSFALDLIFGRSSAFYEKWYEDGLIDSSFSAAYNGEGDHGYTVVGGETEEPERLKQAVLEALAEAKRRPLDRGEFERIRRKAVGRYLKNFNSLEFVANSFIASHFQGYDFFQYLAVLEATRAEGVEARLAQQFQPDLCAVSLLTPTAEAAAAAHPE